MAEVGLLIMRKFMPLCSMRLGFMGGCLLLVAVMLDLHAYLVTDEGDTQSL